MNKIAIPLFFVALILCTLVGVMVLKTVSIPNFTVWQWLSLALGLIFTGVGTVKLIQFNNMPDVDIGKMFRMILAIVFVVCFVLALISWITFAMLCVH